MCKRNLHDTIPNFLYRYYLWLSNDSLAVDLSHLKKLELNPSLKRLHFNLKNNGKKIKYLQFYVHSISTKEEYAMIMIFKFAITYICIS